jgi:colanic acid/amylovoran biosynthesis glycosyltransferase
MSRFPHLPETFILREMDALENLGWQIGLYPLILQKQTVVHDEAMPWLDRIPTGNIFTANLRLCFRKPGMYLSLFFCIFIKNLRSMGFLVRAIVLFPKAVWMSESMLVENIQHVHAHYATHPALAAWIIHRITGLSYSVSVHAHDIFVDQTMLKTKLNKASFIVAISDFNRKFLEECVGSFARAKTQVIHCGIDPQRYLPPQTKYQQGWPFEIVNVGSLQDYKGQIYLLEACAILRDQGVPFRCRVIGEGEQRRALENYLEAQELTHHVELLGALTQGQVADILAEAHCYVQPSIVTSSGKMEGIPVALMEALAMEIPVIASEISGVPELVIPGETGYLVPPADARAIAKAIRRYQSDYDKARQMATKGRNLVLDQFQLGRNIRLLASLFDDVIN